MGTYNVHSELFQDQLKPNSKLNYRLPTETVNQIPSKHITEQIPSKSDFIEMKNQSYSAGVQYRRKENEKIDNQPSNIPNLGPVRKNSPQMYHRSLSTTVIEPLETRGLVSLPPVRRDPRIQEPSSSQRDFQHSLPGMCTVKIFYFV